MFKSYDSTSISDALSQFNGQTVEPNMVKVFLETLNALEQKRRAGEYRITFGKFSNKNDPDKKGLTLSEIYEIEPEYITRYLANNEYVQKNMPALYAQVQQFL